MGPTLVTGRVMRDKRLPSKVIYCGSRVTIRIVRRLRGVKIEVPSSVSVANCSGSLCTRQKDKVAAVTRPRRGLKRVTTRLVLRGVGKIPRARDEIRELVRPRLVVQKSYEGTRRGRRVLAMGARVRSTIRDDEESRGGGGVRRRFCRRGEGGLWILILCEFAKSLQE